MGKRENVGKISNDLMAKPLETLSAIEQMQEQLTNYDSSLMECIDQGKVDFIGDFYAVVITKRERLMPNVFRNYFFCRLSCPTPDYDQTVYKFKRKSEEIVFMWVIPSQQACVEMVMNKHLVPLEERQLLEFVLAFSDGTLFRLAKDLNNEKEESVELKGFTFKE